MVAAGAAVMEIVAVVWNWAHPPVAATVYVTVYVPGVLEPRFTSPVFSSITRPAGLAEYVPPGVPVRVTGAVPPELQYGEPA